jgi:molybdopterin/thiamine biosynthesis adenylyltransferase
MIELSPEEKRKYLRQIIMPEVGMSGQENLKAAKVAIVGAGGLGCPALMYLASSGVGNLCVIDHDVVQHSNLHRQILYAENDVGKQKVIAAKDKICNMHPSVNVIAVNLRLDKDNARELLDGHDVVIDGSDNFATRYVVNEVCSSMSIPLVYASVLGFEGQIAVFNYRNPKNLKDVFPDAPDPEDVPDCSENGVLPTIPGILGLMAAHECLKIILGIRAPSGSYNIFDGHSLRTSTLEY